MFSDMNDLGETPTIIYEHPVTMDIPVTGSWVGHLDGVDLSLIHISQQ